ncbi:hypothetical protein B0H16DRAFT_1453836 [Mycena metata]|uniref:Ribonuclease H1 N-terminal domain-containing protein n=1 Tax=Mycena metata TaxID=1033252 RepID=A0AAD7JN64_9AGAR|nr:hypothetical protein B0H16DRAFT_1453836 [Mycena metata]
MPSNGLTPAEIAALIKPENHPSRLSLDELDNLTADLSTSDLEEVVATLGLEHVARQLPPVIERLFLAARMIAARPPGYEGDPEVDALVRNFNFALYERAAQPRRVPTAPSSPEVTHQAGQTRVPTAPSSPEVSPVTTSARSLNTPQRASANGSNYAVHTPTGTVQTISWFEAGSLSQSRPGSTAHRLDSPSRVRKPRAAAYAVFYRGQVGAFTDWTRVSVSITGHGLAIYSGFSSLCAAQAALEYARGKGWTADAPQTVHDPTPLPIPSAYDDNPLNSGGNHDLWYVVCRGVVPGVYRSWLECSLNAMGVKGNLCNKFPSREAAERAYTSAFRSGLTRSIPRVLTLA